MTTERKKTVAKTSAKPALKYGASLARSRLRKISAAQPTDFSRELIELGLDPASSKLSKYAFGHPAPAATKLSSAEFVRIARAFRNKA
jgi:hypothetical protein